MNELTFTLAGTELAALPSGALWWRAQGILCASDLHLGKAARHARLGAAALPPYDVRETLSRLEADIMAADPRMVICLGDSFDDIGAPGELPEEETAWLGRLMAGRRWIWIEGNHDPGPLGMPGEHLAELAIAPLTFRHIAQEDAAGEVSGHYHPKATITGRGRRVTRPCFLLDARRVILPAYGAYTGGLRCDAPVLTNLMEMDARAILLATPPRAIPMPRS